MADSDPNAPRGSGRAYQWTRSNILGLVAIFIALSGSAVAAQVASQPDGQKAAKKKKVKARQGPPGPVGPPGPAGTTGLQGPAGTSLGAIARGVSISLGSFQFSGGVVGAPIDWTPDDGTAPNFAHFLTCCDMVIEYDDNTTGVADTGIIDSTFTVPPDYASNGRIALRVSKDGHTGVTERLLASVGRNGGAATPSSADTTAMGVTEYVMTPAVTYAPGDAAYVLLQADEPVGGNTANDIVYIHSVEFRYTATQ